MISHIIIGFICLYIGWLCKHYSIGNKVRSLARLHLDDEDLVSGNGIASISGLHILDKKDLSLFLPKLDDLPPYPEQILSIVSTTIIRRWL